MAKPYFIFLTFLMFAKNNLFFLWWILLIWILVARWVTKQWPSGEGVWWNERMVTYEVVKIGHDWTSLVPEQIVLTSGKSYDLQITPARDGIGCMFEATIPKISSKTYPIKAGETFSILVDDAKPGTYPIVCSAMGMSQWTIVVQG